MEVEYELFVGIDWATEAHEVRVVDVAGQVVAERTVEHSGTGISRFMDWLNEKADGNPERIAVAIEIPRGAVVETLVEHGFHAYSINPSSSTASETGTRWPAPRTTRGTRSCSEIRCAPTDAVFAAPAWTTPP